MSERSHSSAVRKIARALRVESLGSAEGAILGSEEDMLARHKVSRPTFRQAAALVAQEQLLVIRRGVGGGYFVSRPKPEAVAHTAAIYLQSRSTGMQEVFLAIIPIRAELARLAAASNDEVARKELLVFLDNERQRNFTRLSADIFDVDQYRAYLKSEREFSRILGRLSNSNILALFLDVLNEFCAMLPKAEDLYRRKPSRVLMYCALREKIVSAILDGDQEVAGLRANRCGEVLTEWLHEDQTARPSSKTRAGDFSALTHSPENRQRSGARSSSNRED